MGETVAVTGVCTRRFDVDVRGWGSVAGLRFRPGGLAALTGCPGIRLDRPLGAGRGRAPATACRDPGRPRPRGRAARGRRGGGGLAALADGTADPRYDLLLEVVADMLADHALLAVAEVATRHGVTVRTLQRLFTHYVGVGPKWVLARYRMHDAVTDLDGGWDGTLTDLALRYGWYDQAHFTRDFTALVGVTPGQYRDRGRGGGAASG